MIFHFLSVLAALALFLMSVALMRTGAHIRDRIEETASVRANAASYSAVEAGLFGLFGLLLAFTFSGAVTRFDERRQAIVAEANAISTAYRGLDLLPAQPRDQLRAKMKEYLAARIEEQLQPRGFVEAQPEDPVNRGRAAQLQKDIWKSTLSAHAEAPRETIDSLDQVLLPAINEAFSIARSRVALATRHPPLLIYMVLFALAGVCSLVSGFAMGTPASRVHTLSFSASLALGLFLILEIEFPRQGFVRLDRYDAILANALNDGP